MRIVRNRNLITDVIIFYYSSLKTPENLKIVQSIPYDRILIETGTNYLNLIVLLK